MQITATDQPASHNNFTKQYHVSPYLNPSSIFTLGCFESTISCKSSKMAKMTLFGPHGNLRCYQRLLYFDDYPVSGSQITAGCRGYHGFLIFRLSDIIITFYVKILIDQLLSSGAIPGLDFRLVSPYSFRKTAETNLTSNDLTTSVATPSGLYDASSMKDLYITVDDKRVHSDIMKELPQNGIFANISLPITKGIGSQLNLTVTVQNAFFWQDK